MSIPSACAKTHNDKEFLRNVEHQAAKHPRCKLPDDVLTRDEVLEMLGYPVSKETLANATDGVSLWLYI